MKAAAELFYYKTEFKISEKNNKIMRIQILLLVIQMEYLRCYNLRIE